MTAEAARAQAIPPSRERERARVCVVIERLATTTTTYYTNTLLGERKEEREKTARAWEPATVSRTLREEYTFDWNRCMYLYPRQYIGTLFLALYTRGSACAYI